MILDGHVHICLESRRCLPLFRPIPLCNLCFIGRISYVAEDFYDSANRTLSGCNDTLEMIRWDPRRFYDHEVDAIKYAR